MNKRLQNIIIISLLVAIVAAGIACRLTNLKVFNRTPDEKYYTYYAMTIAQNGAGSIRALVKEYNSKEVMWMYPTPIRVGYLYFVALVMRLTNNFSMAMVANVSCMLSIISLGIVALMGLRFFNKWITAFALILYSVSPMDLAIARRAWQDEMMAFFALLLIYICCEISMNHKRKIWLFLFYAVGSYCLLIKESAIIIYGLCVFWVLWILFFKEKSFKRGILFICISGLGILTSIAILSTLAGGVANVTDVVRHNMGSVKSNIYALKYQTGSWGHYLKSFFVISPFSTLLCIIGILNVIMSSDSFKLFNEKKQTIFRGIVFFIVSFIIIATIPRHLKNLRYISAIFVLFYFMGALGIWAIISLAKFKLRPFAFKIVTTIIVLLVLIIAWQDYGNFRHLFVDRKIPDLVLPWLSGYSKYMKGLP